MLDTLPAPKKRSLFFIKQVDQASIGELTANILDIEQHDEFLCGIYKAHGLTYSPQPIKIHIDSYGGSVYQCFGLISVIDMCKTPIHTIVTGCAMSCGFMILISGHKRFAYELSTPLYHQISSDVWGDMKTIQEDMEETSRLQNLIESIVAKKTKISKAKLKQIYETKRDWFMGSKEALKLNVVDEIIK